MKPTVTEDRSEVPPSNPIAQEEKPTKSRRGRPKLAAPKKYVRRGVKAGCPCKKKKGAGRPRRSNKGGDNSAVDH